MPDLEYRVFKERTVFILFPFSIMLSAFSHSFLYCDLAIGTFFSNAYFPPLTTVEHQFSVLKYLNGYVTLKTLKWYCISIHLSIC